MAELSVADYALLRDLLPAELSLPQEAKEVDLCKVYPLLAKLCHDRALIQRVRESLDIKKPQSKTHDEQIKQALVLNDFFIANPLTHVDEKWAYRLPLIRSEYPLHSRAVNKAIQECNDIVEKFHVDGMAVDVNLLSTKFKNVFEKIKIHGAQCDVDSLWEVLRMSSGWTSVASKVLSKKFPFLIYSPSECGEVSKKEESKSSEAKEVLRDGTTCLLRTNDLDIAKTAASDLNEEKIPPMSVRPEEARSAVSKGAVSAEVISPSRRAVRSSGRTDVTLDELHPFTLNYDYNINNAGQLACETDTLLLNAFGMKIGGHFDAQVKYPPRLIPVTRIFAMIQRQLSHRLTLTMTAPLKQWLLTSLSDLGVQVHAVHGDLLINPLLREPICFITPEKIKSVLTLTLAQINSDADDLTLDEEQVTAITHYLFELLQGFQMNPGLALGIGANWDGTVNLANEGGAYSFKFKTSVAKWGQRFRQLSLHRQGPAEVLMNAGKGMKYELLSLLTDFDYMTQIKPSEQGDMLYYGLIDNIVAELFPEPAYFENIDYTKYQKHHYVKRSVNGDMRIETYFEPCNTGTYFKDKKGHFKQTPMHRKAGTLEVMPFPHNLGYSEDSRVSLAGNPLIALQLQYIHNLHNVTRGHVVYDPICRDYFIADTFDGQELRHENGDTLPFIGVVPKNFDRHFKLPTELCASFVLRMLHSARFMEYLPLFRDTIEQIKTHFLPASNTILPALPKILSDDAMKTHHNNLQVAVASQTGYEKTFAAFCDVFKYVVYSLNEYGNHDDNFRDCFTSLMINPNWFQEKTRAQCDELIRLFIINKPLPNPQYAAASEHYETILGFLKQITLAFYPEPNEAKAQEISTLAKKFKTELVDSDEVKQYFATMQQSQQTNLSRQQTPGMAFAALKYAGPSPQAVQDYHTLHTDNFLSGYRDPEGNQIANPETYETLLDWGAKKLGLFLQLLHKYQLFALIKKPFTATWIAIKEARFNYPQSKTKVALAGLKGFLWDGLVKGLWQTFKTPFHMLYDLITLPFSFMQPKATSADLPTTISAAPVNTPGLKVQTAMSTRQLMLRIINEKHETTGLIELLQSASALLNVLYPTIATSDIEACKSALEKTFPLQDTLWKEFLNPFAWQGQDQALTQIITKHQAQLNFDLIQGVFRCLTNAQRFDTKKDLIKDTQTFYRLTAKQIPALSAFLDYYEKCKMPGHKIIFRNLFSIEGKLEKILDKRNKQIQTLQQWFMQVFDAEWVKEKIFNTRVNLPLQDSALLDLIPNIPESIKAPMLDLFSTNKKTVLDDYVLQPAHKEFLLRSWGVFNTQSASIKTHILNALATLPTHNTIADSEKDKAQQKWQHFAERELNHRIYTIEEAKPIFDLLLKVGPAFSGLLRDIIALRGLYADLTQSDSAQHEMKLTAFYTKALNLLQRLRHLQSTGTPQEFNTQITALKQFIDITLNSVINARLDAVDIFSESVKNPLIHSTAIQHWLAQLQIHPDDLRSFLAQQTQQSASLDHALWRQQCLLTLLEKNNNFQALPKTGIKSLLRLWYERRDNMTAQGELYREQKKSKKLEKPGRLFVDSKTMQQAFETVTRDMPKVLRRRDL